MAGKLNAKAVDAARSPRLYPDGEGLYLQVTANKKAGKINKSWVYRYRSGGKTREMGLGQLSAGFWSYSLRCSLKLSSSTICKSARPTSMPALIMQRT